MKARFVSSVFARGARFGGNTVNRTLKMSAYVVAALLVIFTVTVCSSLIVNNYYMKKVGTVAYSTIITDLAPERVITIKDPWVNIRDYRRKRIESYETFQNQFKAQNNKTIIHRYDSIILLNIDDERYWTYIFEFEVERGVLFNKYTWENPMTGEITGHGGFLISRSNPIFKRFNIFTRL